MKKRGVIEIQFNWILVLVAGALIFMFFFGIIRWAQQSTKESSSATISAYLDSILTGASVVKETVNRVDVPFEQLEFTCDNYRVDKSSSAKSLRNKIIFAPSSIEKGQLVTWSLGWNVPFRVTNFLFVSSPQIRYVFIGEGDMEDPDNKILNYLYENFPEELNPEFYDSLKPPPSYFEDLNNFKVRFVYVGLDPAVYNSHIQNFKKYLPEDVTALKISDGDFESEISLVFYNKNSNKATGTNPYWISSSMDSSAFGEASLIAAIFSESAEEYECSMKKAFKRMGNVVKIYKQRSIDLADYYNAEGNTNCEDSHNIDFGPMIAASTSDPLNFNSLGTSYSHLKSKNNIAQQNSCALIY